MEKIGSYKIVAQLSDRPSEASFKGWDEALEQTVVLRQINSEVSLKLEQLDRLVSEQKRLNLHDPHHAVRFYGLERIDKRNYLHREYVEGEPLSEKLAAGPLGRMEFYNLSIQIMQGLNIAHEYSVVHGRLTPNNVIVTERGQVRLTESGLPLTSQLNPNQPFHSPELKGKTETSEAGDIYAAGILFYQMLTGELPKVDHDILANHPIDFSTPEAGGVGRGVRLLIEKMVSTDPRDRGKAEEILSSLRLMLSASDDSSDFGPEPHRKRRPYDNARSWMALSVLSMLLVIFWLVITTVAHQ